MNSRGSVLPAPGRMAGTSPPAAFGGNVRRSHGTAWVMEMLGRRCGVLPAMQDGGVGASGPHVPPQSRLGTSDAWCGCVNHLCFGCAGSMVS